MTSVEKLARALQIATISSKVNDKKPNVFDDYHKVMEEIFPLIHEKLEKTVINEYALVYKWSGKNKDKEPIIMIAHYDVVPVEEATLDNWSYPPFSGQIADGYVWGRGALDTKITMIAAMEGVEKLLAEGFTPDRDIYLAFGHDEEVAGTEGAVKIVEYFLEKGISFEYLIDEGGAITTDAIPGVEQPLAVIGIAEKGYADVKLTMKTESGHSSTPPPHTSVGLMSKLIVNLEKHQMPMSLDAVKGFFKEVGPAMSGFNKIITSNLWLFGGIFKPIFSKSRNGNALLRTTTAATMISGSMKPNVLPEETTATINFRIASHQCIDDVVKHIEKQGKGMPLTVEVIEGKEPSAISSSESIGFDLMRKGIKETFGDVLVAPYLTLARTDSRSYEPVATDMYRFGPYMVDSNELKSVHSVNERISEKNVEKAVMFYEYMYKNC